MVALVLLSLAGFTAAFDGAFLQDDSAQYVSMAKNLLAGRGAATSLAWSEEHLALGRIPVAQTNLPPGYPVLIALVSRAGVEPVWAALLVSAACFAAIPLLLYWLLRSSGVARPTACAVSVAWFCLPIVWVNVLACLSEMSYIAVTLAGVACVRRSELSRDYRAAWLLLAGGCAGAAFLIRYAALIFVLSLVLFFVARAVLRRDRWALAGVALVAAPAVAFGVALLARNYRLTGTLIGGLRRDDTNSLRAVLRTVTWSLGEMSGFTKTGLLRGDAEEWLLLVLLLATLAWLVSGARARVDGRALRAWLGKTPVAFSMIYVAGSLVFLIGVATLHASGAVTSRYLLPLIPFALLLAPGALRAVQWQFPGRRQRVVAAALAAGAIVVFLAGQADVAESHWSQLAHSRYRHIQQALAQSFRGTTVRDFLATHVPPGMPVLGNEAQLTGVALDRPVVGLPGAAYSRRVFTAEETHRILDTYGVAYVVFFPSLLDAREPNFANQAFFTELKGGKVPGWLHPDFSSDSIRLYRVTGART